MFQYFKKSGIYQSHTDRVGGLKNRTEIEIQET